MPLQYEFVPRFFEDFVILLQTFGTLCPAILPALEQSYYVHAAVAANISINAMNIPPSVRPLLHGNCRTSVTILFLQVNYVCEIRYRDGRQVFTLAYSRSDTEIVCQVKSNQVSTAAVYVYREYHVDTVANWSSL